MNSPTLSLSAFVGCLLHVITLRGGGAESPPPPAPVDTAAKKFTNRLSQERSPYLLQHQHNPVDWYPWGAEAFAKAKKEGKPIFLSIGYSTCHWCHVMERESFENEAIAKYLNEHFVSIKLDREERPDIDGIYMTAMQALRLGGGWPLNVFLTSDIKPFYGGTYFKPEQFTKLLEQVQDLWKNKREELQKDADNIALELGKTMDQSSNKPGDLKPEWIDQAAQMFVKRFDATYGGFKLDTNPNKFPQPQISQLILLAAAQQSDPAVGQAMVEKVLFTCQRMAAGGMYDQLGGGFSRYSVDSQWLVPHFEKMLYDNGQLVNLYLDAYLVSGQPQYAAVVKDILRYLAKDMTHADGGFYSAEDADSEGHEGKFYCWTEEAMKAALTAEEFAVASKYFGVTSKGNFVDHSHPKPLPGQNVLSILKPDEKLSAADEALLTSSKSKLLAIRVQRVRPHLDDKILVSWNGLMLSGLARAGIILEDPSYLAAAQKNVAFMRAKLWDPKTKTLANRYRDGHQDTAQILTAYAYYLHGLVEYYQVTLDPTALDFAIDIAESMLAKFYDPKQGGFYASASEGDLIFRVKDDYDGAEPSGNSVAILALLKLAAITDRADLHDKAKKSLKLFATNLSEGPQGVPLMLQAASFCMKEPHRVVIVGDPTQAETKALLKAAHHHYFPGKVILGTAGKVEPFAKAQPAKDGKPTAYVCTGTACQPPTNDPKAIAGLLKLK